MNARYPTIAERAAYRCEYCHAPESVFNFPFEAENQIEVVLFHPRRDTWALHFAVDVERAEIVGRSAVGRATIERLRMNRPRQINARRRWIQLGVFP